MTFCVVSSRDNFPVVRRVERILVGISATGRARASCWPVAVLASLIAYLTFAETGPTGPTLPILLLAFVLAGVGIG